MPQEPHYFSGGSSQEFSILIFGIILKRGKDYPFADLRRHSNANLSQEPHYFSGGSSQFTPLIDLEQLAKDENITIKEDEIKVNWDGEVYRCGIGPNNNGKVFHLYGWDMGVYYYLYYKYGYLFNQDIIETPEFEKYVKDDVLDIYCNEYKKACLEEMEGRLCGNGPLAEAVLKKIEEDLKKYN